MTDAELSRIDALLPDARAALMRQVSEAETAGLRVFVSLTTRSREEQARLWAEGTKTANPVSWHELRRAWHLRVVDPETGKHDVDAKRVDDYRHLAFIARQLGIRGLGFHEDGSIRHIKAPKGKAWDPFHFEWRQPHATLVAAVEAEAPHLRSLLA